jgi:5-phospho-D-xylono-1,4-lactonase
VSTTSSVNKAPGTDAATGKVRTVAGDIDPTQLGVCDAHDHLFLASPAIPGTPLDDPEAAEREASAFRDAGGSAIVQWSPAGTGRQVHQLARIAKTTGLHLIAATGQHRRVIYDRSGEPTPHEPAQRNAEALTQLFVQELTWGIGDPNAGTSPAIRAGIIKVAAGYRATDEHERRGLSAAAAAHLQTGAPICVHLELGTHGIAVLEILESHDVEPQNVVLGHLARNPDLRLHRLIAATGAWLCLDGPSSATHATDWRLLDVIGALLDAGHRGQILLGADSVNAEARSATGGGPGSAALLTDTAAAITREFGERVTHALLVENPARAYTWRPLRNDPVGT